VTHGDFWRVLGESGRRRSPGRTELFVNGARFAPSPDAAKAGDLLDAVRDACVDARR
jgi:hypothetical protein